jgi:hypothetical protein
VASLVFGAVCELLLEPLRPFARSVVSESKDAQPVSDTTKNVATTNGLVIFMFENYWPSLGEVAE